MNSERAEAGRILMTSSTHNGVSGEDRTYLVQQVASTGLSPGDAEKRVDQAIADSKTAIARSRRRDTHRSLSNQIHLFVDSHFDEAGLRLTW
jgi:hypothetical protein